MILFGVRSPIVVELEESCLRAGLTIRAALNTGGPSRVTRPDRVISKDDYLAEEHGDRFIPCAFAPSRRRALTQSARAMGLTLADALIDPSAIVASTSRIDPGCYINAGAVIGAVTLVGEGVLINRSASVGHHCVIGDYTSIGPGAVLAGNVHVGQDVIVGAGAVILPNVRIGDNCVIAAGATVRRALPEGSIAAGSPARTIRGGSGTLAIARGEDE